MGTVNGARSFDKTIGNLRIEEGRPADFSVVRLGAEDTSIIDPVEQMADRLIQGGSNGPEAIVATYVNGQRVV
jgi:cytosine/adenosine deaminase-related metal-dependent hydrolase